MKIRINLTEAKKAVDPKQVAIDKKAEAKKVADKKKADDKKKEDKKKVDSKKKLKESLYPIVKKMLSENYDMETMEEDTLNEVDPGSIDWAAVAAGLAALGLSGVLIGKIQDLWKKKFPKSFEKAQAIHGATEKIAGK